MSIAGHHLHGIWDLPVNSQLPVCFCLLFLSSPVSVPLLFLSFAVRSLSLCASLFPVPSSTLLRHLLYISTFWTSGTSAF